MSFATILTLSCNPVRGPPRKICEDIDGAWFSRGPSCDPTPKVPPPYPPYPPYCPPPIPPYCPPSPPYSPPPIPPSCPPYPPYCPPPAPPYWPPPYVPAACWPPTLPKGVAIPDTVLADPKPPPRLLIWRPLPGCLNDRSRTGSHPLRPHLRRGRSELA